MSAPRASRSSARWAGARGTPANGLGSDRSTIATTCASSRASPKPCAKCCHELLRDLGAPFPAVWARFEAVHNPRDAARLFAKVLGQLEVRGYGVVRPALEAALADGTPLLLALAPPPAARRGLASDAVPVSLRDLTVPTGCAADYDRWLLGGVA